MEAGIHPDTPCAPDDTFQLDLVTVTARDIADVDLAALQALSVSVGWPHRAQDWTFMREVGRGRVAVDEAGRVHGAAMWFPFGDRHATFGMVITTPRLQMHGGGQWLVGHAIAQTAGRMLGLHATAESHRLFLACGFVDEGVVYQHEGHVADCPSPTIPSAPQVEVRTFAPGDRTAFAAFDRAASGWDRSTLIDALLARSEGVVLLREGRMDACALVWPFGRGVMIGPVFAPTEEDALRVVHPLLERYQGRYVRIDTDGRAPLLDELFRECGLRVRTQSTRMSYGEPWPFARAGRILQFGLATQSTG